MVTDFDYMEKKLPLFDLSNLKVRILWIEVAFVSHSSILRIVNVVVITCIDMLMYLLDCRINIYWCFVIHV